MTFISQSSPMTFTPLPMFQVPCKAQENLSLFLSSKEVIGIILCAAVITTLAVLTLRARNVPSSSSPDIPFDIWPFDRPMPKLLTNGPSECPIPLDKLAKLFCDHVFITGTQKNIHSNFSLILDSKEKLTVKYQNSEIPIHEIFEHVEWDKLDEKWQNLSREGIDQFLKNSLIFENLSQEKNSPFNTSHPFIKLYTTYSFYSWLNPLLRGGILKKGLFPNASQQTNKALVEKNARIINQIANELLFLNFAITAELNRLPAKYRAQERVIRLAHIPKEFFANIDKEEVIVERGFMSASGPGGGFAGGGPCDKKSYRTKFFIQPKTGCYVKEFSDLNENEVLFTPFTRFKILERSGDAKSGYQIHLEEIPREQRQNI